MRLLKVALVLLALGALSGAVVGVLLLVVLSLLRPNALSDVPASMYGYAAAFGAGVGAITGPAISLIFLRRVPLWRATLETAGAAGLGASLAGLTKFPYAWAWGALVFAMLAAVRLRHVYRDRTPRGAHAEG